MSALHRVLWSALPSLVLFLPGSFLRAADIGAAVGGTSTNGFRALVTADRTSEPLLAPASREGEIRLKQFKHAPKLRVDLWAAEPMLANPVAFSVDEKGRVFTSETYRYRSSVLDIRHYMFMLEDDLASRSIEDRLANIRKWFGPDGERALSTETEVIRLIEDTNGDGVADKSSVFADGFTSPLSGIASGVLARHGEVWVTEIPSLWRFTPNAGGQGGKPAGQRATPAPSGSPAHPPAGLHSQPNVHAPGYSAEELLSGFGVRFSFTGHDLHGLKFGPDGRLYFSCGDRGAFINTREGTVIDLPDEGAVFRCEPDGSKLEVVHRGLRNPQELAFNEYGDLFTGDNDSDQGDRERWVQVIEGADSGWRVGHQHAPLGNAGMWNMERLWVPHFEGQAAYILPPIANIGDGPSGLVFDATHRYGKEGARPSVSSPATFLLSYFKGTSAKSGIYALTVEPRGAGYALVSHDEFLWNALVPDVDLAPDGSVFFADWHEGWPKSNKGRLYRASLPTAVFDPVLKQTAKLLGEGMTNLTEQALIELLAFPDMRVRQEAQFELAGEGDEVLRRIGEGGVRVDESIRPDPRDLGIGQLARNDLIQERDLEPLQVLLRDNDDWVRAQILCSMGKWRLGVLRKYLPDLARDSSARVRAEAVTAIGNVVWSWVGRGEGFEANRNRVEEAVQGATGLPSSQTRLYKPLLNAPVEILDSDSSHDPILRHATVICFERMFASDPVRHSTAYATNTNPSVRVAALLALRRLTNVTCSTFLSDPDPLLILEAARAINDVPITNALPALAELAETAKLDALLRQFGALKSEGRPPSPRPSPPGRGGNTSNDGAATRSTPLPLSAADPTQSSLPNAVATPTHLSASPSPGGEGRGEGGPTPRSAILDTRADQPLPWGDAPIDHLTPMLLRVVNANFRVGTAESATRLAALAARTDLPVLIRTEALNALATWAKPFPRDRIVGTYRPLPPRDPAPAREALGKSLRALAVFQPPPPLTPDQQARVDRAAAEDPGFQFLDTRYATEVPEAVLSATAIAVLRLAPQEGADLLFRMVASQAPTEARATALRCLAELVTADSTAGVAIRFENGRVTVDNPSGDPALARTYSMLGTALQLSASSPDEALRLEASRVNAVLNPGDAAGQLAAKLTGGSVAEQQSAYASLGDLKSEAADALLAEALDRLMKRDVANEVMLDLVLAASKRDADAVKTRLAAYQDWKLPKDHLSPFREALFGGDAARGRKTFYENAAVACTRCHQIGGDGGGNAGPKLDGLASRVTREHLLESVVFPNQQVVQGFETAMITLKDGQTYAGVVKSENDEELVVLSPEEGDVTLRKAGVQTREKGLSGMPEGMGSLLTLMELRDVIEFLGTLK